MPDRGRYYYLLLDFGTYLFRSKPKHPRPICIVPLTRNISIRNSQHIDACTISAHKRKEAEKTHNEQTKKTWNKKQMHNDVKINDHYALMVWVFDFLYCCKTILVSFSLTLTHWNRFETGNFHFFFRWLISAQSRNPNYFSFSASNLPRIKH